MLVLTRQQRNALYDIIMMSRLDPAQCKLVDDEQVARLSHEPSESVFTISKRANEFTIHREVGKETYKRNYPRGWKNVEALARAWANSVREFIDTPDLWAGFRREQLLSGAEYETMSNALFNSDERLRIAQQLREIKSYLTEHYALPVEQISQIEAKLDEIEEASRRLGRKDWLNIFYGVMFTLIVTQLVPPDAVQHIIALVIHGLGDLFGFGGPPSLPPVA